MKIPKIIHQTWKNDSLPKELKQFSYSWKKYHPNWDYKLWTDDDNRIFIEKNYPWFLKYYDSFPFNIQRVDAARYFILYSFGGIYADLDVECLKSIQPLLSKGECILALEPPKHCKFHETEKIIGNAFMACVQGHPFIKSLIFDMAGYRPRNVKHKYDFILKKTGPLMLTRVYNEFSKKNKVKLLSHRHINPLSYIEADLHLKSKSDFSEQLSDAFTIHYFSGTWWKNK